MSVFKKFAGWLHLWLGLASGIVVVVLGITGCLYAFERELKDVFHRDRLYIEPQAGPVLPLTQLLAIARKELGDEKPIVRIEIPREPGRSYIFRATKTDSRNIWYWNYFTYYHKVYVNPYDGKVIAVENTKRNFFQIVFSLHTQLLLGDRVGHVISSYSVLMFVILLLTGMILWWPKKWKASKLKTHLTIKWKAKFKRINYDLHRVLGFYAFILLMILSLTGLVWSFEWVDRSIQFVATAGKPAKKEKPPLSDTTKVKQDFVLDRIWADAQHKTPEATSFLIVLPAKTSASISILSYLTENNHYQRIRSFYDQHTGEIIRSGSFDELTRGEKLRLLNYDLHTGTVLNLPGKILAFCGSLIAAALPITGFLIWWRRKNRVTRLNPMKTLLSSRAENPA
jgi:uncharacterized iron-regulated membrane protein